MKEQLEEIKKRYELVGAALSEPNVAADQKRYQSLTKELAEYRPVVAAYDQLLQAESDLRANHELVESEKDPEILEMAKEESQQLEEKLEALQLELEALLLPKDPNDERNVILEIRAGTGGDEAGLFAADLFRMYQRFAEVRKWKIELMDSSTTGIGGLKEIVALISGDHVYSALKFESGVHRVQRVPKTETSGRIHTSAVTVAVLPEAEDVDIAVNESDLRIDTFRASGPGGQGVNTTDSAVRITHVPTDLVVVCREERSQIKNRAKAMKLLRTRLLEQQMEAQAKERSDARKSQIGSGDRSEKIRTYNFPQSRVTDHRIGKTIHQLESFLAGDIDEMIEALHSHAQAEALKAKET